jgi:ubiquinone/menaquinone biosynthesis C-methylase UbiE
MSLEVDQVRVFEEEESWNYFQRNHAEQDLRSLALHPTIEQLYRIAPPQLSSGAAILEIGCSGANNLHQSVQRFKAARGAGTEVSPQLVAHLSKVYPEYTFKSAPAHQLPFATDEFDLVIIRCVLSWIPRSMLLQSIGEAIRVAKKYLIVSDFVPALPYSVEYHHRAGCRTFKQDYGALLTATGLLQQVASFVDAPGNDYESLQCGLFEKLNLDRLYPLRTKSDFDGPV